MPRVYQRCIPVGIWQAGRCEPEPHDDGRSHDGARRPRVSRGARRVAGPRGRSGTGLGPSVGRGGEQHRHLVTRGGLRHCGRSRCDRRMEGCAVEPSSNPGDGHRRGSGRDRRRRRRHMDGSTSAHRSDVPLLRGVSRRHHRKRGRRRVRRVPPMRTATAPRRDLVAAVVGPARVSADGLRDGARNDQPGRVCRR